MHILLTTDTIGGVWSYTCELTGALMRRGHRITLVGFGGPASKAQSDWAEAVRRSDPSRFDFHEYHCGLEWMQGCESDLAASSSYLRALIAAVQPDLLHFNQFCYGALEGPVPRVVVAHSDVLSWWQAVHAAPAPPLAWIERYRAGVRAGLAAADRVVAPSAWMAAQLAAYDCPPGKVSVIWNGCDAQRFDGGRSRAARILTAGRLWDAGKNVAALARLELEAEVVVIGEAQLAGARAEIRAAGNVRFTGPLPGEAVRDWMETSAVYVVTSRYEPFGLAALEAALSGCAVVANDLPSLRELWGDAILYCDMSDAEALATTLRSLLADEEFRRHQAQLARQHAVDHLGAEGMTAAYERLYAETRVRVGAVK